jgi:hypothetical protein
VCTLEPAAAVRSGLGAPFPSGTAAAQDPPQGLHQRLELTLSDKVNFDVPICSEFRLLVLSVLTQVQPSAQCVPSSDPPRPLPRHGPGDQELSSD